jgi:hypothetical protein
MSVVILRMRIMNVSMLAYDCEKEYHDGEDEDHDGEDEVHDGEDEVQEERKRIPQGEVMAMFVTKRILKVKMRVKMLNLST